jgi:hypothetical protein
MGKTAFGHEQPAVLRSTYVEFRIPDDHLFVGLARCRNRENAAILRDFSSNMDHNRSLGPTNQADALKG